VKIFLLHDHKPPTFIGVLGSFLCHPSSVFLLFGAPKATSSVSFSSGVPFRYPSYFSFRLPIQLGSTKPPTIRRSSPIRNPPVHSFVNPIPVWRTDVSIVSFFERSNRVGIPPFSPSRLSTKHQVVSIILTQTTAPNSRSLLIHQLLGVTLVVAAVSLQHKSVTGAFVQAHQLGKRIPLLVCSRFLSQ